MTYPRYSALRSASLHFFDFSSRFALLSRSNTRRRFCICSSQVDPGTRILSMYTMHFSPLSPDSTDSISRWKAEGAFTSPKGMTLNSYSPECVTNAVFSLELGSIVTCQKPDTKSNVLKNFDFDSRSSESSMRGRGNTSIFVTAFSRR